MTRLLPLVLTLALSAVPVLAQPATINLAAYRHLTGGGFVIPIPVDIDNNPQTTEWMLLGATGWVLVDGVTGCGEAVMVVYPQMAGNVRWTWATNVVKVSNNPNHQLQVWDMDDSDGVAPFALQPIRFVTCR